MSSTNANASQQVGAAVELIAQALDQIAGNASARTVYCEIQARAACDALKTIATSSPNMRPPSNTKRSVAEALTSSTQIGVGQLLAEAELIVGKLPADARNQIAVCAAMSFLRRARRALAET